YQAYGKNGRPDKALAAIRQLKR
ncbi:hypothetical protein JN52_004856, partial [Salmonella enterica]|nr:hypothetical protein [Salmonella enterica]